MSHLIVALAMIAAQPDDAIDCNNAMNQQDMNFCAEQEFERADAELNALWRRVIAEERANDAEYNREYVATGAPPVNAEQALREAQRAWIAFRDAQCTYEGYENFGGSLQPLTEATCRTRMTRERIAQLQPAPNEP